MLLAIAQALGAVGQLAQAREVLAEARAFKDRSKELYRAPEFDRVEANLLLFSIRKSDWKQPTHEEEYILEKVTHLFESSLEMARAHHARSFELKTAIDFAAFRRKQGRIDEARAILEPVLSWFRDGFDTPFIMRAQAAFRAL